MTSLKPLKSSIGQPAEGDKKYYLRKKIVARILRKLNNGENIVISAPRRIGKSSLLKHIKNTPQKHQIIKYIIVQSVNSSEEFFKKLYHLLLEDKEIYAGITGYLKYASISVTNYIRRIREVSIEVFPVPVKGKVDMDKDDVIKYYSECMALMQDFDRKDILIFIDEFPDALNNILKRDRNEAIHFLQQHRVMRQALNSAKIQFVYTGSTGLRNIVKKLNQLDLTNDLHTISIPPFTVDESQEFIQRLVLGCQEYNKGFSVEATVIDFIITKISWRLPYYLQIIVDSLFEYYEDTEKTITTETVEYILLELVKARSNYSDYFENWRRRLKEALNRKEYYFAIKVLNYISQHEKISYDATTALAQYNNLSLEECKFILEILEYDGYISEDARYYGFNSFLLKEWWLINVAK